jgi:hypothetical protein
MSTCSRTTCAVLLTVAAIATTGRASAQSTAQDQATARALFIDARQLMRAGKYDQACPKLEAASKLYTGSGVLLNLGDCYEHVGRTASAWTEFAEAASAAERDGRADDLAEAKKRQAAIEPRLCRLTISVPHDTPGLEVRRDDTALDRGAWGIPVPVDPGTHAVSAQAPGRVSWSGSVSVSAAGKTASFDVPDLAPAAAPSPTPSVAPAPAPSTPEPPPPGQYWTGRRTASAALTGVGVVSLGVGGVLVILAKSKDSAAQNKTTNRNADSSNAVSLGNMATVFAGAGAAVAATGLLLWLTAPDAPVQVGANPSGLLLSGRF